MRINRVNSHVYNRYNLPLRNFGSYIQNEVDKMPSNSRDIFAQSEDKKEKTSFSPENVNSLSRKDIREKITTDELEQVIRKIYDEECQKKGIPENLKPELKIIDSIQFASVEEINETFKSKMKNPDPDFDIFKDSKKRPQDMSRSEFIKYISKRTKIPKKEVEKIMQTGRGKDRGFYSSLENTITYYTQGYRQGTEMISATIVHELHHVKEAFIRSSLPQQERDEIVKNELIDRLIRKESRNVFKQKSQKQFDPSSMMTVPIMDDATRLKLTNFAQDNLFSDDMSLSKKMQRYSELLSQDKPNEEKLAEAKADLGGLAEQVEEIASKSRIYIQDPNLRQAVFGLSKSEKNKLLFDYMMSVEFRYQLFREKEIKSVPEESDYKNLISDARESISKYIDTTQATYAMNVARETGKNTGDDFYWDYYTSREEVEARIEQHSYSVEKLERKLRDSITEHKSFSEIRNIKKQLDKQKQQLKEDETLYKFFQIENELKTNPRNIKLRLKYYISANNVEKLHSKIKQHNMSILNKMLCFAAWFLAANVSADSYEKVLLGAMKRCSHK